MATANPFRCVWIAYGKLKTWIGEDPTSKRFTIEADSFVDPETTPSSESNNGKAGSTTEVKYITIVGLIYPSTKPFQQRGLRVEIQVPNTYPQEPPAVYMRMSIRHPNIEKDGRICSALLDQTKTWNQDSLANVVKIVTNLMDKPELGYVVDGEMGSLYDTNITNYNNKIMEMVTREGVLRT